MKKVVVILGPTASGKTCMSIKLAQKFDGEIICADSRTIYTGMDIGTAKPTIRERNEIPHHLLDITTPDKPFSAAQFKNAAQLAIDDIQSRGRLPFLVGGSGMYIDSVIFNYGFRDDMNSLQKGELEAMSLAELRLLAAKKYPIEFRQIDHKNRRRVEQLICKGPSKDEDRLRAKIDSLVLGLDVNKAVLKQNIAKRTNSMLSKNFIQEVEDLRTRFGDTDILSHTTGYSEIIDYLDKKLDKEDLEASINSSTWQLVRKQLTWFKRNTFITWINSENEAVQYISEYLEVK